MSQATALIISPILTFFGVIMTVLVSWMIARRQIKRM